ncbi:MAG: ABC transporter ATP-binding protein [Candidatus Bathyarchaeia archaeon]
MSGSEKIISVSDLVLHYRLSKASVKAVDGISFELNVGETLALVGESGCGKSSMANAMMRILPRNVQTYKGVVKLDGIDIMKLDDDEFRQKVRWKKMSMVFQGAMNALNPVIKIGEQVAEPLIIHDKIDKKKAIEEAKSMLRLVGMRDDIVDRYPHELSGGMKQRAIIAMALILKPRVIILDEPTSALDLITQANIMNLLKRLKRDLNLSYILITHDLALASDLSDSIAVMYAGKLVEIADADRMYSEPLHPYSKKLIDSVPMLRTDKKPNFIPGAPPNLSAPPTGCRFHPRCPNSMEICKREEPLLKKRDDGGFVACWLYG